MSEQREHTRDAADSRYLQTARCQGCGAISKRRPIGRAPEGWRKVVALRGRVTYLCEKCQRGDDG